MIFIIDRRFGNSSNERQDRDDSIGDTTIMKNAWKSPATGAALIVLLTLIAYLPALPGGFVWDDASWTTDKTPLLRDVSGLRTMWRQPTALQQYYPLTGTTFWLDYHFWGFRTLPYHVENVLLHACAAFLFWRLLRRLEVPGGWLAAAIFALHPVMVESAAWITERKNVLSLVLYLGALLAYGRFASFWKDNDNSPPRWRAYVFALLLTLAALLAKTTAVSLPAVILLIGWWKRGRIRWRADVLPTLPFFALAIGMSLVTAWLEKNHLNAQGPEWAISFPQRCLIAGRALWFYTGKLLWPVNLCFIYPRWQPDTRSISQWLYPITATGTLVALWLARRNIGRGPAAAAFFFVGTVFPLLGFINSYGMRYSFVWDHWTYLSSLGLIALAAALLARAADRLQARVALYGCAAVILPVLMILTWRQCRTYADMETLWRDTLARNPTAWMAHTNLGLVLLGQGKTTEALAEWEQAVRINPDNIEGHNNFAAALARAGRLQEAVEQCNQVLRLTPYDPEVHYNLALTLLQLNRLPEAIDHFEQSLSVKPDFAEAHFNLANALWLAGRLTDAIEQYQQALRLRPDYVDAHFSLANALQRLGRVQDAIDQYEQTLRLKPDFIEAQNNLARLRVAP
jgi:tetratricopeptide (TPR) repeat protein